jgi:hypothetical protein
VALEATFQSGNLKAWFRASADFLAQWHPFHFDARAGVSVGVSYRLDLGFTTATLSVEIGADLHLYGPPTGGEVSVDWYVISFSIPFGPRPLPQPPTVGWTGFRELLPPDNALLALDARGLRQETQGGEWMARPDEVGFTTRAAIPATRLDLAMPAGGPRTHAEARAKLSIRPMGARDVETPQTLTVRRDGAVLDLRAEGWTVESETQGQPEALWGAPLAGARPTAPSAALLPGCLAGYRVQAPRAAAGATPGPIDVERELSYEPVATKTALAFHPATQQGGPAPVADPANVVRAIAAGAADGTARGDAFAALAALGAAPATAGSLAGVARDAALIFAEPPLRAA